MQKSNPQNVSDLLFPDRQKYGFLRGSLFLWPRCLHKRIHPGYARSVYSAEASELVNLYAFVQDNHSF